MRWYFRGELEDTLQLDVTEIASPHEAIERINQKRHAREQEAANERKAAEEAAARKQYEVLRKRFG